MVLLDELYIGGQQELPAPVDPRSGHMLEELFHILRRELMEEKVVMVSFRSYKENLESLERSTLKSFIAANKFSSKIALYLTLYIK